MTAWFREVTSLDVSFRKMTSVEGRLEERYVRRLWPKKQRWPDSGPGNGRGQDGQMEVESALF